MGKCERWTIAYRKRDASSTLIDDRDTPFITIPNTWRYWRADPFLVDYQNKTYLFAESYDRTKLKGVLSCCEFTPSGPGKWTNVLEEPFHLSYPFIFRKDDTFYMIPESCSAGRVIVYEAIDFPYRWEVVRDICPFSAVDSTIIPTPTGTYMLSLKITNGNSELVLMRLDERLNVLDSRTVSEKDDPNARPAGSAFYHGDRLIRPSQDCSESYGCALNLMQIHQMDPDGYREELLCKLSPRDLVIKGATAPQGLHTYNMSSLYEVIDYKVYEFGLISKLTNLKRRVLKLIKND